MILFAYYYDLPLPYRFCYTFTSIFVQEWQYFQELAELNIPVYAQLISSLEKAVFC